MPPGGPPPLPLERADAVLNRYLSIVASILVIVSCSGDGTLTPGDLPGEPQWRELNRIPVTRELAAVWGSGSSDVFAASYSDADMLHFDGSEWTLTSFPRPDGFHDIWGSSSSNVFAAGRTIERYDGNEWATVYSEPYMWLYGVWGSSVTDVWFCGGGGLLIHYDGAGFATIDLGTTSQLKDVWGSGPDDVYVVGSDSLYHFDGASWGTSPGLDPEHMWKYSLIAGSAADDIVLSGRGTARFDGVNWTVPPQENSVWIRGIWCRGRNDYYGTSNTIVYHFDGGTWSEHFRTPPDKGLQNLNDVWVDSQGTLYAVGWDGAVWRERRGELELLNGSTSDVKAIWAESADNVFVGTEAGELFRWDGDSWREDERFTNYGIHSLWGVDEDRIWSVTTRAELFFYNGDRWREVALPETIWPRDVWEMPGEVLVVAGQRGIAMRDRDGWTVTLTNLPNATVWGRSAADVYGASGAGLLHYDGDVWTRAEHSMGHIYDLFGLRTGEIYAATGTGIYVNRAGFWNLIPASPGFALTRVWGTSPTNLYFTDAYCRTRIYQNDGKESEVVYYSERHCFLALWGTSPENVYAGGRDAVLIRYSAESP